MNKRIKQLADQCMVEVKNVPCKGIDGWTTLETVRQLDPEKFADLIVKECVSSIPLDMDPTEFTKVLRAVKNTFRS
jgi:hypothetical protein